MTAADVAEIMDILENAGIDVWLDGGWAIDALLGKQTRPHEDLDVVVALSQIDKIKSELATEGFSVTEDELPTRLVLKDTRGRQIDFHTVTFDSEGGGVQVLQNGRSYRYPPQGFTAMGEVNGRRMKCLSAEVQAECHYGYEPDEKDWHDMKILRQHFGIKIYSPYL